MMAALVVAIGGGLGALSRYWLAAALTKRWPGDFPIGTLGVNVLGSLLIGLFAGALFRFTAGGQTNWYLLAATGFCGGFTTFSTAAYDAVMLGQRAQTGLAWWYSAATMFGSIAVCALGFWLLQQIA